MTLPAQVRAARGQSPARAVAIALALGGLCFGQMPTAAAQSERRSAATEHLELEYPADLAPWIESNLEALDRRYRMLAGALDTEFESRPLVRIWPADAPAVGIDPASRPLEGGLLVPRLQRRQRLDLLTRPAGTAIASPSAELSSLELDLILLLSTQLAAEASDGLCPASLALGAARYLQPPDETQARMVAEVKRGMDEPPSWAELMEPGAEYQSPERFQAWSLSLAHHLIHRKGLAAFVDLLRAFSTAAGWRDAMQLTYHTDPSQLEAEWIAALPGYVDGAWRRHLFYGTDLAEAEAYLAAGDFRGAALLARAVAASWDPAVQAQAQEALALAGRAEAAQRARAELDLGQSLLDDGHYSAAAAAGQKAADTLAEAGDALGSAQAAELTARAERGQSAVERLRRARALGPWRALEAGLLARGAAADLQLLGHRLRAAEADAWARHRLAPVAWSGALCCATALAWMLRWWLQGRGAEVPAA